MMLIAMCYILKKFDFLAKTSKILHHDYATLTAFGNEAQIECLEFVLCVTQGSHGK
jgi:hypothetical protein